MHRTLLAISVFLGALFIGQIVIPQVLVLFFPQLNSFLTSIPINIAGISFNLIGFVFSSVIAFPFLVFFLRQSNTSIAEG